MGSFLIGDLCERTLTKARYPPAAGELVVISARATSLLSHRHQKIKK